MPTRRALIWLLLLPALVRAADADPANLADSIGRLAAVDADTRTAAASELMALRPADLPALLKAAAAVRPLRPAQAEGLRGVITHVLARQNVLKIPHGEAAFLGVSFPMIVTAEDEDDWDGVLTTGVIPGFAASRFLHAGDVIVGFVIDGHTAWVSAQRPVSEVVKTLRPGTAVEVLITRNGRPLSFTIVLDARPSLGLLDEREEARRISILTDEAAYAAEAQYAAEFARVIDGE